jgi:hypothetical protein
MLLMIVAIASGVTAVAGYFYLRPPRIGTLSNEALRNAVRIADRQGRAE